MTHQDQSTTASQAREAAEKLAEDTRTAAQDKARETAEDVRDNAAEEVDRTAHAAEAAAGEFDPSSLQAQAISKLADTLEDVAGQVRATDIDRLARSVSGFARENPAVFVGGAALLGFAATRLLKARPPQRSARSRPSSPYVGRDMDWDWDRDDYERPDLTTRGAL